MEYKSYSEVPYYRKNWFVILTWFLFWPACLVIMWTGDVYYEKKKQLVAYGKVQKIVMSIIALFVTISAFM